MQTDTLLRKEGTEVQKIKDPVTNNPLLVQILGKAGFIVTNDDVIVKKQQNLILRKRIHGENPDGSPKYYDVPLALPANDFAQVSKAFSEEVTPSITPTIPTEATLQPTEPTNTETEVFLESAMINNQEVLVGQVLATAPHIAILDFVHKGNDVHAILINMKTGATTQVRISDLEAVSSLAGIESLFSH